MTTSHNDVSFNFYPIKNSKTDAVANMTVVIGQFFIRGFSVRKSKTPGGLYISPPHKKLSGGGWAKLFWTDKEVWKKLEQSALGAFEEIKLK